MILRIILVGAVVMAALTVAFSPTKDTDNHGS
ncbi:hypothetical protein SEA_FRANKLIN22_49 [Microbacterium phage Franklin22]|nr:hypothetical protein QDW15_gp49 [Microbacterium phage Franklin22]UGL61862.1 hypothetical protein SEA_FRANKLIN22_49 [Microbacterium phage Franklin22]